ncbi:hypothetical protein [Vibrio proteolyticus]
MKRAILISVSIISAALVFNAKDLADIYKSNKTIELPSGGTLSAKNVTREETITSYKMYFGDIKKPAHELSKGTGEFFDDLKDAMQEGLSKENAKRQRRNEPPLTMETAFYNKNITLKYETYVYYYGSQPDYPDFSITIDKKTLNFENLSMNEQMLITKSYIDKSIKNYRENYSLLN